MHVSVDSPYLVQTRKARPSPTLVHADRLPTSAQPTQAPFSTSNTAHAATMASAIERFTQDIARLTDQANTLRNERGRLQARQDEIDGLLAGIEGQTIVSRS